MKKAIRFSFVVCAVSWTAALIFHLCTGYNGHPSGDTSLDAKKRLGMMAFSTFYMFFPAICAIILQKINKDSIRQDFSKGLLRFKPQWSWLAGYLLVPVIVLLAILVNGLFAKVNFSAEGLAPEFLAALETQAKGMSYPVFLLIALFSSLVAGITINAIAAFGEEYGWRYYMVNALKGQSFWKSALLIGGVWGLWHFPVILMGHNYPDHRVAGVFMMCVMCILLGIIEMYFVLKARSVYPAAIIHGTFNALAGFAIILVNGGNDLLNGMPGLSGFIVMIFFIILLFLYDKYISRDHIFTNTLEQSIKRD